MPERATIAAPPPFTAVALKLKDLLNRPHSARSAFEDCIYLGLLDCALLQLSHEQTPTARETLRQLSGLLSITDNSPRTVPVSLYVPAYNAAHYLEATLRGILAGSVVPAQLLVIDDGSRDHTRTILSQFPVEVITHAKNQGLATARNSGLAAAQHELVACLDSDVVPDRYWLERLYITLAQDTTLAGVSGRLIEQRTAYTADRWRARMMPQHYGDAPLSDQPIYGCNGLFRRTIARALSGYNPEFLRSFEDIDFSRRLLAEGYHTRYLPDAFCRHQRTDTAQSVVDTCFQWRLPYLHGLGALSSVTGLGGMLATGIRHDLREFQELALSEASALCYLSFLLLLRAPLLTMRAYAGTAATAHLMRAAPFIRDALCTLKELPHTRQLLETDLHDLLVEPVQSGLESDSQELPALAATIKAALEPLPHILRFSPETQIALEKSARDCAQERVFLSLPKSVQIFCQGTHPRTEITADSINVSVPLRNAHALTTLEHIAGFEATSLSVYIEESVELEGLAFICMLRAAQPESVIQVSLPAASKLRADIFATDPLFRTLSIKRAG